MKIIDRYVGQQLAATALFAVGVLSVVLVLGNVFKRLFDLLVNHDVPLHYIVAFITYILPFSLTFTIPWGFLTAVLLVFGKLSGENELIALRTCGISIPRICMALFALTLFCTAICFWINIDIAPRAQKKMHNAIRDIATKDPISMFGSDQVIDEFPGNKIYVDKKKGNKLYGISVYELSHGDVLRVVYAKSGWLETDIKEKRVLLHLDHAHYEQHDEKNPSDLTKIRQGITADHFVLPISLAKLYQEHHGFTQMTLGELLKTKEQTPGEKMAKKTEINKRFSFSLACLAFALVGVPLAIGAHRRESSIGFALSLIIAFSYFLIIELADMVRDRPAFHPALLIWLPNVIFISLGAWMFWRLSRK